MRKLPELRLRLELHANASFVLLLKMIERHPMKHPFSTFPAIAFYMRCSGRLGAITRKRELVIDRFASFIFGYSPFVVTFHLI